MNTFNFPPTSRYSGVAINLRTGDDGETIPYVGRRFLPLSDRFALLRLHRVSEGERPDLIAASELGDPEAFWRIADANDVLHPDELSLVGKLLRITLPEGIPGTPIG